MLSLQESATLSVPPPGSVPPLENFSCPSNQNLLSDLAKDLPLLGPSAHHLWALVGKQESRETKQADTRLQLIRT